MASKRQLIEPKPGDKRDVRRDSKGQFKDVVDVGRSLAQDRKRKATKKASRGRAIGEIGSQAENPGRR